MLKYFFFPLFLFIFGCTNSSLTPISNSSAKNYSGESQLLVAVDGIDERKIPHIVISSNKEPEGY